MKVADRIVQHAKPGSGMTEVGLERLVCAVQGAQSLKSKYAPKIQNPRVSWQDDD